MKEEKQGKNELYLILLASKKPFGRILDRKNDKPIILGGEKAISLYIKNINKLTEKDKEHYGGILIAKIIKSYLNKNLKKAAIIKPK